MMETKHTKGPWQLTTVPFELRSLDSAAAIYGPIDPHGGSPLIADISRSTGDNEADANAKLIVAAPELLEALAELKRIVKDKFLPNLKGEVFMAEIIECESVFVQVDKAIKKATE